MFTQNISNWKTVVFKFSYNSELQLLIVMLGFILPYT